MCGPSPSHRTATPVSFPKRTSMVVCLLCIAQQRYSLSAGLRHACMPARPLVVVRKAAGGSSPEDCSLDTVRVGRCQKARSPVPSQGIVHQAHADPFGYQAVLSRVAEPGQRGAEQQLPAFVSGLEDFAAAVGQTREKREQAHRPRLRPRRRATCGIQQSTSRF